MVRQFAVLFYFLCALILFQDFIGIFLFNIGVPKYLLQLFLSLKDILIIALIFLNLAACAVVKKHVVFNRTLFFFTGYFAVVILYFLYFGGLNNGACSFNDLRSLIFPVYAYLAGYTSFYLEEQKTIKFIEKIAVISIILSLFLYFMGDSFLVRLKVLNYTEDVRGFFGMIFRGLPSTYFTVLSKMTIFRLAGPILNPNGTALIYIFVFCISLSYYRVVRGEPMRRFLLILLAVCIFLTFSRGAIVGLILGLVFASFVWTKKRRSVKSLLAIYCALLLLIMIFYDKFYNIVTDTFLFKDPSIRAHYNALFASIDYLKYSWFGRGVGSSGMWSATEYTGGAGENSFVSIVGQVGVFALFFMIAAYVNILKNLINNRENYINFGLLICAIVFLFTAMFSPSLLTVTPSLLFWFFIGYSESNSGIVHSERKKDAI